MSNDFDNKVDETPVGLEEEDLAEQEEEEGHVWMEVLDMVENEARATSDFSGPRMNKDHDVVHDNEKKDMTRMKGRERHQADKGEGEDTASNGGMTAATTTILQQEQTPHVIVPVQPGSFAVYPLREEQTTPSGDDPAGSANPEDASNNKDVLDIEGGVTSNRNHHSEVSDENEDGEDASVVLVQAELAQTLDEEERDRILQQARLSLERDAVQASVVVGPADITGSHNEKKQEKPWMKGRKLFIVGGVCALIVVLVVVIVTVTQVSNANSQLEDGEMPQPTASPTASTFWIENRTVELQNMLLFATQMTQLDTTPTPDDITTLYNVSVDFWYDYLSEKKSNDLWNVNPNAVVVHEFEGFTAVRFDLPPRGDTIELAAGYSELKLTYRTRVAVDFMGTPPPVLTSSELLNSLNEACLVLPDHLREVIVGASPLSLTESFAVFSFIREPGGDFNGNPPTTDGPPNVDDPKAPDGTDGKPDDPQNNPATKEPVEPKVPDKSDAPGVTEKPVPTPSGDKASTNGTPSTEKSARNGTL